jgi:hypothetical protein
MMDPELDSRINSMFKRDVLVAVVLAAAMWASLIFTFSATVSVVDDAMVSLALAVSFTVLGAFNTMGLLSMRRRYKIEREHVYGEDIHHLDANRKARQARRSVVLEVSAP